MPMPTPIERAQDGSTPALVQWLSRDGVTAIDTLVERSGWPVERVLETLVELELAGFVMPLDGGYIRVRH
jgi:predicted Rossmann fold nucleotide-binding protein DprA/Smf involved in DNA uptake